jgi:hypothetical protein
MAVPVLTELGLDLEVLDLINQERAKVGINPLNDNDDIDDAADRQAFDMATNNNFSEIGSDGSTLASRVENTNYPFSNAGEVIAFGPMTPAEVVAQWLNDPTQRNTLLNPTFTDAALGVVANTDGNIYWAETFGGPDVAPAPVVADPMTATSDPLPEDPMMAVDPTPASVDPMVAVDPTLATVDPMIAVDPTPATEDPMVAVDPTPATVDPMMAVDPTLATEDPMVAVDPIVTATVDPMVAVDPIVTAPEDPMMAVDPIVTAPEDPMVAVDPIMTATADPMVAVDPIMTATVDPMMAVDPITAPANDPTMNVDLTGGVTTVGNPTDLQPSPDPVNNPVIDPNPIVMQMSFVPQDMKHRDYSPMYCGQGKHSRHQSHDRMGAPSDPMGSSDMMSAPSHRGRRH